MILHTLDGGVWWPLGRRPPPPPPHLSQMGLGHKLLHVLDGVLASMGVLHIVRVSSSMRRCMILHRLDGGVRRPLGRRPPFVSNGRGSQIFSVS